MNLNQTYPLGKIQTNPISPNYNLLDSPAPDNALMGIEWNQLADVVTRTIDASYFTVNIIGGHFPFASIRRCNLSDGGAVRAYWGESGFKYDGSNGQVMVEFPKFYYKARHTPTFHGYMIEREPIHGCQIHPWFITDGRIVEKQFVGAFEACCYDVSAGAYNLTDASGVDFNADTIASIAGAKPLSGLNNTLSITNARKLASNRGAGWHLEDFNSICAQQLLYLVKYGNFNSQAKIGTGVTNITDDSSTNMAVLTGATAGIGPTGSLDLGNNDGYVSIAHYQTGQTTYPVNLFGKDNFFGNIYEWKDGLNIKSSNMPWIADHDYASDTFAPPYTDTGLSLPASNGYGTNIAYSTILDYGFLPSAVGGSSTTYLTDDYYQSTGNRAALLGGHWISGAQAGAFLWSLYYSASNAYRTIGARAAFTPQN